MGCDHSGTAAPDHQPYNKTTLTLTLSSLSSVCLLWLTCALLQVLHHLSDPSAGLKALTSVLADHGGMGLMVYGELGRRGIYDFHDMYRLLGERRNPALARKLVAALPDTSWLKKNKNMLTGDFEKFGDSGVTDLLVSVAPI